MTELAAAPRSYKPGTWTAARDALLAQHYTTADLVWLLAEANRLPAKKPIFSVVGLQNRATALGLRRPRSGGARSPNSVCRTADREAALREGRAAGLSFRQVLATLNALPGRPFSKLEEVKAWARTLKLPGPPEDAIAASGNAQHLAKWSAARLSLLRARVSRTGLNDWGALHAAVNALQGLPVMSGHAVHLKARTLGLLAPASPERLLALRQARNAQRAASTPPKPRPAPAAKPRKRRPSRALPPARAAEPAAALAPPAVLPPEEVDARLAQRADQVRAALREATQAKVTPDILRMATQFRMPAREVERLRRETLRERHAA